MLEDIFSSCYSHLLTEKLLNAIRETLLASCVFCFLSVHKAMLWHLTNFAIKCLIEFKRQAVIPCLFF